MAEVLTYSYAPSATPSTLRPVSPAAHLRAVFAAATVTGPRAVQLREIGFLTMVGVRVEVGTESAVRLADRLGVDLPARCGAVARTGSTAVLWLSPDEFLVVSDADPAELTAVLTQGLGDGPGSVVDLSANRTTFVLSGPSALGVLQKGCPLDLHPRSFGVDTAYVTSLGTVPILLWKTAPQTYRVVPRASFADHVGRWLVDAMTEFSTPELMAPEVTTPERRDRS